MRRLRRGSCSWACSALLVALAALVLAATPGRAATDDQNLTGLVYLADESPLSAAAWANNTSFAVYVNHNGNWSTAWRYPAWPAWYLTSGGAYSIVLPAAQKDVTWSNGDPYRVEFDASEISGVPGTVDNATSHGTGDPGDFSPSVATENAIVWSYGYNCQRWDVVVLARPDYVPAQPQPGASVRSGLSSPLAFSVQVLNQGVAAASVASTLAFYNASTPAAPFATFAVPPLGPSEPSARFTASWTSRSAPGAVQVVAEVDYGSELVEGDETNNGYMWIIDVLAGPVTDLVLGQPNVPAAPPYVTSATALSFSVVDQSGAGIRNTTYRIDGGAWVNYTASGPFSLAGEGAHHVQWSSTDFAGNVEALANATLVVDDTPPAIAIDVGAPRYTGTDLFVTSSTPLSLSASDGGVDPVGLATLEYRLGGGPWIPYSGAFTVGGPDGPKGVDGRAADLLGNPAADAMAVVLDDTPPVTTPSLQDGTYPPQTTLAFSAMDGGSAVARTEVRVDGGPWTAYAAPLQLSEGHHVIGSRSIDNLNNTETSRVLSVTISSEPAPLPLPELNWKPLVAAVFAALLAIVGAWSSRRVPLPTGSRRALRAFTFTALPFIVAEAGTGVVSFFTGLLAIPPLLGTGTIVDVAILAAGVTIAVLRARPSEAIHPAIAKIR